MHWIEYFWFVILLLYNTVLDSGVFDIIEQWICQIIQTLRARILCKCASKNALTPSIDLLDGHHGVYYLSNKYTGYVCMYTCIYDSYTFVFWVFCQKHDLQFKLQKFQAKKLGANIEMTGKEMEEPTYIEVELTRRLGQLTDHLIQKQSQVQHYTLAMILSSSVEDKTFTNQMQSFYLCYFVHGMHTVYSFLFRKPCLSLYRNRLSLNK